MTNLRFIFGIITICALIAFVGCKKDDDYATFTIDGDMSLDFEYGQTKEVSYTTHKVVRHNIPEVSEGWECVHRDGKYYITAPQEGNTYAQLSGSVELSAMSNENVELTRLIAVRVRVAEEIVEPANSFIVSEPGKRYKFNALRRGNETTETITGAVKATRLWATSSDAITNVSYEDGYVYFATSGYADAPETFKEANAVIALLDGNDVPLWSWHIWATLEDPTATAYLLAGEWVMDRNMGAFSASNASAEDAWRSYGLYYQWGRKDPFVGPDAWNSTVPQTLYTHNGSRTSHSFVSDIIEVTAEDYATDGNEILWFTIHNPDAFIAGIENADFNWSDENVGEDLWGAGGAKSVYDPCPAGWRVAPREIFASFTTTGVASTDPEEFNVVGEYNYGWTFDAPLQSSPVDAPLSDGIFFPAAGRRSFSPTLASSDHNYTNVVNDADGNGWPVGFYWTDSAPVRSDAAVAVAQAQGSMAFRHDYVNPANSIASNRDELALAGGFPVRCVADR